MSSEVEYFENSPLILALLQFRYEKIDNFDVDLIKKLALKVKKDFPNVNPQIVQGIKIDNSDNETNISLEEKKIEGVQIKSKNNKEFFTVTDLKFTFQSHEKYSGWDNYVQKIKGFWESYSEGMGIKELTGISLRYVNKFNLPLDVKELTEYFNIYLKDDVNTHSIRGFQFKYNSYDKKNNYKINIGHALEKPIDNAIPYLIDIDVLYDYKIKNNNEIVWKLFDGLREKKNHLFSNGLTQKAKNLIN